MNREIKFRGIRVDNGEFVYGDLLHLEKDFKKYVAIIDWSTPLVKHEVKPETVGQYTGLLDKNGKEIYEGDIVQRGVIVFNNAKFQGQYYGSGGLYEMWEDDLCSESGMVVLGNIYENPDLLQ